MGIFKSSLWLLYKQTGGLCGSQQDPRRNFLSPDCPQQEVKPFLVMVLLSHPPLPPGSDIIMQLDDVVSSTVTGPRVEEAMYRCVCVCVLGEGILIL